MKNTVRKTLFFTLLVSFSINGKELPENVTENLDSSKQELRDLKAEAKKGNRFATRDLALSFIEEPDKEKKALKYFFKYIALLHLDAQCVIDKNFFEERINNFGINSEEFKDSTDRIIGYCACHKATMLEELFKAKAWAVKTRNKYPDSWLECTDCIDPEECLKKRAQWPKKATEKLDEVLPNILWNLSMRGVSLPI